MTKAIATVAACAALLWIGTAHGDDESKCLGGRSTAKGKYERCVEKFLAKAYGGYNDYTSLLEKLVKCRSKYQGVWDKLATLTGSPTCGQPRYLDNGNGTVTDNLSGLMWEKKSDNGDVHDKDNTYTWNASGPPYVGNGTAFTTFLRDSLNAGGGFAGANDWRLPTFAELQTILFPSAVFPCVTIPCVHYPTFHSGPCNPGCTVTTCTCTKDDNYWTGTETADSPLSAWYVNFLSGSVDSTGRGFGLYVRAVRGGL